VAPALTQNDVPPRSVSIFGRDVGSQCHRNVGGVFFTMPRSMTYLPVSRIRKS